MNLTYSPGPGFLVSLPGLAFLTPDERLARRAWATIGTCGRVDDLLVALLRDGLPATAAFVLVDLSAERVRVLARGELAVRVDGPAGAVAWTGAGVTTWSERVFDRVTDVVVDDGTGPDPLPLREGLVRCAGFELHAAAPAGTAAEPIAAAPPPEAAEPGPGPARSAASPDPVPAPPSAALPSPAAPPPDVPVSDVPVSALPPAAASTPVQTSPPILVPAVHPVGQVPMSKLRATAGPDQTLGPDRAVERSAGAVTADPAQTRTETPDDGFEHLFESTIARSVEDAAIRDAPDDAAGHHRPADGPDGAPSPRLGDHDGYTITAAQLGALRRQIPSSEPVDPTPPPGARLELSTGDVVALDGDVVIGRRPEVDRVQGGRVPTVLTVPSPRQDVSRTHLRIGWSGGKVLATDLHSMNGTVLTGADGTARTLEGGVPHPLVDGDTLDIGDGITLTLRLRSA